MTRRMTAAEYLARRLDRTRESLADARQRLAENVGTLTEQDYRDMVARFEARVAALEVEVAS